MNTQETIKNIAEVITGYTFRSALPLRTDGPIQVIQAKDVGSEIRVEEKSLARIKHQEFKTGAFVRKNDVIFSARGNFRAGVFDSNAKNIMASSSVYILRITDKNVLPEFLAIFLNSVAGQKQIKQSLTGGAIKTILRKDLENLKVAIPEIAEQKLVIDIYKNSKKQWEMLRHKQAIIKKMADSAINKLINSQEL